MLVLLHFINTGELLLSSYDGNCISAGHLVKLDEKVFFSLRYLNKNSISDKAQPIHPSKSDLGRLKLNSFVRSILKSQNVP